MTKDLTPKQLDVLCTYGRTGSTKKTAELLYISERTVRNTLSTIYARIGVSNGVEAVWKVFVEGECLNDRAYGVVDTHVSGEVSPSHARR